MTIIHGTFGLDLYCQCGATLKLTGMGRLATATDIGNMFWAFHLGDGHGPTDQRTASAARRRAARTPAEEI